MSSIHNLIIGAGALMLVFIGASCSGGTSTRGTSGQPTETPASPSARVSPSPTPTAVTNSASPTPGTGTPRPTDSALPTRWAMYRNADLGIAIPYPEGWYVEEDMANVRVSFYKQLPPELSDMPASMWIERENGAIRSALSGLNVVSEIQKRKAGREMTRVEFLEDFYDPNPRVILYLWEEGGQTVQFGGPETAVVEYAIDRLEVLR